MTAANSSLPALILGRTREGAVGALGDPGDLAALGRTRPEPRMSMSSRAVSLEREGSRRLAAKAGDVYLVWGVDPSPIAMKAAESILALYQGDPAPDRVFYACYAGTHSSVLAASLHLGMADGCQVCDLPLFDRRAFSEIGVPALVGVDREGTEVYAFGTGWLSSRLEQPLCDLIEVVSPASRACVCSVRGFLDFPARVGGFASRRCSLVRPGRGLIAASLTRKIPDMREAAGFCLDLSLRWKDNEGQPKGEVIWVDGREAGRARVGSPGGQPRRVPGD